MKPYSELANAIILRAIDVYRRALDRLNYLLETPELNGRQIVEIKREIDEIEKFFRSEWYAEMTDISGEDVIRKIRRDSDISGEDITRKIRRDSELRPRFWSK